MAEKKFLLISISKILLKRFYGAKSTSISPVEPSICKFIKRSNYTRKYGNYTKKYGNYTELYGEGEGKNM